MSYTKIANKGNISTNIKNPSKAHFKKKFYGYSSPNYYSRISSLESLTKSIAAIVIFVSVLNEWYSTDRNGNYLTLDVLFY